MRWSALLCCALGWERNEWKANPREKIYVGLLCGCNCVVLQPCCAVLCAMCMQLGAGRALLCAPVCCCTTGVLLCSGVLCGHSGMCCTSLLCAVLHGLAVLCVRVLRSNEQLRCVGCWSAMLSRKLCCALVCLAVLCCALLCAGVGEEYPTEKIMWLARRTSPCRMHEIFKSHTIWMAF